MSGVTDPDSKGFLRAMMALPLLLLPMVLGTLALLFWPAAGFGMAAILFSTIATAWYLLGGAVSVIHIARYLRERRALRAIRAEVASTADPVWISNKNGEVLYQNTAAFERSGDVSGMNIKVVLGRMRADPALAQSLLTRRAARHGSGRMVFEDGQVLEMIAASDAPLQIWSCHHPDTAPHASEIAATLDLDDEVQDSDGFDLIPVALLRLDPKGEILHANAAARQLLGMSEHIITQHKIHLGSLLEGPGRPISEWVADCSADRMKNGTEVLRLRTRDGRDHYFQVSLARNKGADSSVVAVLTDASDLKRLEAQFVQSQKMQAIGQLAGGVAHDFNNLLTAISGHCDLLMLRRDKGDPDYADLDQISQNTNRAAALVAQLLAFSRKQTLKLEPLDLRDTLADLTHLLRRLVGAPVSLSINHDPQLHEIRADRRQLEQVIINLVVNARDAMLSGGEISIRTSNLHLAEPYQRDRVTLPSGDYVKIEVSDQGRGIAPEDIAKIFEPFFTTKRQGEGTGLGLSTAYGIIKQTGGFIFCDSEPEEGTCFSLYFTAYPASTRHETQIRRPPEVMQPTEKAATILLAEDEAPVRAFVARALGLKGYEVLEASDGETALSLLADDALQVSLFLSDVVMPGMDGPSWVRAALQDRPDTKVIFMSGYSEDVFTEGHVPLPNSAFLSKPFSLAELTSLVEQQLQ